MQFGVDRVDLETEEFLSWARREKIRRVDWARAWGDNLRMKKVRELERA